MSILASVDYRLRHMLVTAPQGRQHIQAVDWFLVAERKG